MDTRSRLSVRRILLILLGLYVFWQLSFLFFGSRLQIGRETTFVDGPLKPDGTIDYAAALHERLSMGVTPEDNAAVLILQAFGSDAIPPEKRAEYFERIGIVVLPDQRQCVLTQTAFIELKKKEPNPPPDLSEKMLKEFSRAQEHPWSKQDHPLVAEWLDANAAPLELIVKASRCSQFYSPPVEDEGLLQSLPSIQGLREAARLLTARAMFRMGIDDVDGAWSDLLACHRLAGLVGSRSPSTITYLIAVAMNSIAAHGDAALIGHGFTVEQAQMYLTACDQLPPFGDLADVIYEGSRMEALDATQQQMSTFIGLDMNTMLRNTNGMFDDLAAALRQKTPAMRQQALDGIDKEFEIRIAISKKPLRQIASLVIMTRRTITQTISNVTLSMLMPACAQADTAQTRMRIRREQVRIGFALAAYRAATGIYPQSLDELAPQYLGEIPLDPYTEKPFVYVPREAGFLIYSIGPNGKDDGGIIRANNEDDTPFEVPPKVEE